MKRWSKIQRQSMVDFLNNLGIVILTIGIIQPLFDKTSLSPIIIFQFLFSFLLTIIILIINFYLLK